MMEIFTEIYKTKFKKNCKKLQCLHCSNFLFESVVSCSRRSVFVFQQNESNHMAPDSTHVAPGLKHANSREEAPCWHREPKTTWRLEL